MGPLKDRETLGKGDCLRGDSARQETTLKSSPFPGGRKGVILSRSRDR